MALVQVVFDQWPLVDVAEAAAVLARVCGGTPADRALQLARCRGLALDQLDAAVAPALLAAWQQAGIRAFAVQPDAVPQFSRPSVARQLQPQPDGTLLAHISLTGPPERLPASQVLLVLPGHWQTTQVHHAPAQQKKSSAMGLAMDLALTGGVKTMLSMRPGKSEPGAVTETTGQEPMVELWLAGPPRRIQCFAHRLDYSALPLTHGRVGDNWLAWLQELQQALPPGVVGQDRLTAASRRQPLPADSVVGDNNDLARTGRWLLLRAVGRRLGG
jgi:hypothetical protein